MKLATLVVCALLVSSLSHAGSSPDKAQKPVKVGAAVTVKKATDIDQLSANAKQYVGQTVRIEGTVKAVCQHKGCWVEVTSPKGTTFTAKSLDESVLLPKDSAGRKVIVQGVVTTLPAKGETEEQHAHHEADGHDCPQPRYVVDTRGAELLPVAKR
jgi:hypothetical protein